VAVNTPVPPIPQTPVGDNTNWKNWFNTVGTNLQQGVSGTFKSADSPAKTVTVVNGIITSIK
jgi:hypothetical protein